MLKSILLFIKAHAVATTITATVVIGTAIATPIVIDNYILDKTVKENLGMLVSSNYQGGSSNEAYTNTILNNNEIVEMIISDDPVSFRIERFETEEKYPDGTLKSRTSGYKIVPSYNKDYSKWTKKEKEEYQEMYVEVLKLNEEERNRVLAEEAQTMKNIESELQKEINSWSKEYNCGVANVSYNSYTKKYKGGYTSKMIKNTDSNDSSIINYSYEYVDIENVSAEEFRNVIYPILLQNFEEFKSSWLSDEIREYKSNLNELYHLSE